MHKKIPFNHPLFVGTELKYISRAVINKKICGDGEFTEKCNRWLERKTGAKKVLLTTSCTHALEMTALLTGIGNDDEVIMPSFTFVSTANAFALRGAKIVFVDIRPDTMNIDESLIPDAITRKTRAIVPIHYAGVGCEMDTIMSIARKNKLFVIEDAAQGIMSSYKQRSLGCIGHLGCYSFHETKNYHCGEGGAIVINDARFIDRAEIIREKGTNRKQFLRGKVCRYTWVDKGSSYLPSELNAAFLYAHLEKAGHINKKRLALWKRYYQGLEGLAVRGLFELPFVPDYCSHNGHTFYVKLNNSRQRSSLMKFLKNKRVQSVFHYIPLHLSSAGKRFGRFVGKDRYTTKESERLLRLPMYHGLSFEDVDYITGLIKDFFHA
jgi:dTDP-4-amino-4,6-dideoxygalactose transaminase